MKTSEPQDALPIFDFELCSRSELEDAWQRLIENIPTNKNGNRVNKRPDYSEAETDRIINAVTGMTELEVDSALARAVVEHFDELPNCPVTDFVSTLLRIKTEALKRSDVLELMPMSDMSNVGGLDVLKAWLELRRSAFTTEAREAGVDRPKGILLVGAPGTGKSLVAKATASMLGLPIIKFDISRVYGSLVGQSEQKVRGALKMLEALSPSIVLADEPLNQPWCVPQTPADMECRC